MRVIIPMLKVGGYQKIQRGRRRSHLLVLLNQRNGHVEEGEGQRGGDRERVESLLSVSAGGEKEEEKR